MVDLNPLHEMGGQELKGNMAQGDVANSRKEEVVMGFSCLFSVWCPTMFPEIMEHLGTQRGSFQSMVWLFFPVEPADAKKALRKHHSLALTVSLTHSPWVCLAQLPLVPLLLLSVEKKTPL